MGLNDAKAMKMVRLGGNEFGKMGQKALLLPAKDGRMRVYFA